MKVFETLWRFAERHGLSMAMTLAEQRARAIQRAHNEHIYIRQVRNRPGVYTTWSRSEPRRRYILVLDEDGTIACSCRGFYYRKVCKHSEGLRNRLARERGLRHAPPAQQPLLPAA